MLSLRRPTDAEIRRYIDRERRAGFSYRPTGMTGDATPPRRYTLDHNRVRLGSGRSAFARAVDALRRWEMFHVGWASICWPDARIEPGTTVALLARHFGFWSLNACRIVYVIDDRNGSTRFGFAYGTVGNHVEAGEERFLVEWSSADDSVWYDILALSRPRHPLVKLTYPLGRALQRRFARDSLQAMIAATSVTGRTSGG